MDVNCRDWHFLTRTFRSRSFAGAAVIGASLQVDKALVPAVRTVGRRHLETSIDRDLDRIGKIIPKISSIQMFLRSVQKYMTWTHPEESMAGERLGYFKEARFDGLM